MAISIDRGGGAGGICPYSEEPHAKAPGRKDTILRGGPIFSHASSFAPSRLSVTHFSVIHFSVPRESISNFRSEISDFLTERCLTERCKRGKVSGTAGHGSPTYAPSHVFRALVQIARPRRKGLPANALRVVAHIVICG
jgi:hypothetical protein